MPDPGASRRLMCVLLAAFSLLLSSLAGAQGDAAKGGAESQAKELKSQGDEAMDSLRYEEALDKYTKAYQLSRNPALLYNRGRAFEALTRYPEALDEIIKFEAEAPPDLKKKVPQLTELITSLRNKVSTLRVSSNVAGSRVVVRSKVVGTTPLPGPLRLNSGEATVEVTADGYHAFKKTVDLPGGSELEIKAELRTKSTTGILRVDSPVAGASVIIDGKRVGKAPAERALPAGKHQVLVQADGYEDSLTSAVVEAGTRKVVKVDLEKIPPVTARWWFWTGAGVIVAGGVALTVALLTEGPADKGDIAPGQVSAPLFSF